MKTDMKKNQHGFSLVELAIALTVIGLLLAGVVKGRELMQNARTSRVVADMKYYESATRAFRDMYNELPGDMLDPRQRLPNFNLTGAAVGNGDGIVGPAYAASGAWDVANMTGTNMRNENRMFWLHLAKARMINTIDENSNASTSNAGTLGFDYPESAFRGVGYDVYYWEGAPSAYTLQKGHYIKTKTAPLNNVTRPLLSASLAAQIDRKIDDGKPLTGRVLGWNRVTGSHGLCYVTPATTNNRYSQSETARCEVSVRVDF